MAQDGSKMALDGSKMVQDGSKMAQDGSKMVQDGSEMAQDGSKMALKWPKTVEGSKQANCGHFVAFWTSKTAPRQPQDMPRTAPRQPMVSMMKTVMAMMRMVMWS